MKLIDSPDQMTIKIAETEAFLGDCWAKFAQSPSSLKMRQVSCDVDNELRDRLSKQQLNILTTISAGKRRVEWAEGRRCMLDVVTSLNEQANEVGDPIKKSLVHTSISHTQAHAISIGLMGSCYSGVGVDLESASRKVSSKVIDRVTVENERAFPLSALDIWVIKESCFKADHGISSLSLLDYRLVDVEKSTGETVTGRCVIEGRAGNGNSSAKKNEARWLLVKHSNWIVAFAICNLEVS